MNRFALVIASAFGACLASSSIASPPAGPTFGNNSFSASLSTNDGVADVDDYLSALVAGEKLSIVVAAASGSSLHPSLTLVAPDGTTVAPSGLVASKGGSVLTLRPFAVAQTGVWDVRVSGAQGTTGGYTAAFKITTARAASTRNASVTSTTPALVPFDAINGALLNVTVTSRSAKAPVSIRGITDPQGRPVAGVAARASGRSVQVRNLVLNGGDGTYHLDLATSAPDAGYGLKIQVTPQGRATGKKPTALSAYDPFLDPVAQPLQGVPGGTVTITGGGFDPANPPTVLFGDVPGVASPAKDGKSMVVVVPDGLAGLTVAVTVVGRDGQTASRAAYFHYVELPLISDLVDASGVSIRAFDIGGGGQLTLRGQNFAPGQQVFFGNVQAQVLDVVGTTAMDLIVPAQGSDQVQISVVDAYGRTSSWPIVVDYVTAPTINTVTVIGGDGQIDASDVSVNGDATVQLSGADFDSSDVVTVGGNPAQVIGATDGTLTIIVPPGTAGDAPIVVTTVLGQQTTISGVLTYQ